MVSARISRAKASSTGGKSRFETGSAIDGGGKTGSGSAGGEGAPGLVTVASGCAGLGVADGVGQPCGLSEVHTESGMNMGFGAGFGGGAEITNDSRVNDAMGQQLRTWYGLSVYLPMAHRIVGTCAGRGPLLIVPAAPPSKDPRLRHGE